MRDLLIRSRGVRLAVVAGGVLAASTAAFGLPWDVDMMDSQAIKGYEANMRAPAEGAVAQENVLSPRGYRGDVVRESEWLYKNYGGTTWVKSPPMTRGQIGDSLQNPVAVSDESLATGETMYNTYCTPCHGDGIEAGAVGQAGRFAGVVALAGDAGVLKNRSDGYVYMTILNGGAIMPTYGWAMSDEEIWSLVNYSRTLPNSAYNVPAPADEVTE